VPGFAVARNCGSISTVNTHYDDRRLGSDRRKASRGGRRDSDPAGAAPLVLIADDDAGSAARSEAILCRLRFAVAPAASVEEAVRVMRALRPEVVVARLRDNERLRYEMRKDPLTADIPVVVINDGALEPERFVEEVRAALRPPP
jgi:PleD family two-component response regulator